MKKFRKIAIIKFAGGLGNQMFQYSYGEYLKLKGYEIYHDYISWFILYNRKFTIKDFNLNLKIPHKILIIILTFLVKIRCSPFTFFEKKPFKYQNIKDSHILHCIGYWQNIEYLRENTEALKKSFISKITNKKVIELIKNMPEDSVAIHVRRGDYVNNEVHETIGIKYFKQSIDKIKTMTNNPHFYVISDDISWCKNNLKIPRCVYVDFTENEIEDFEIIKLCTHKIISNSTFSWWAAFLGEKNKSITICPKKWTNKIKSTSLQLPNWIKI